MRRYRHGQATTRDNREMDTLGSRAARVVEDAELLREVLRRVCLINPDCVRVALEDAEARIEAIRAGGYIERFGK